MTEEENNIPLAAVEQGNAILSKLSLKCLLLAETPYNEHNAKIVHTNIPHDFDEMLAFNTELIYVGQDYAGEYEKLADMVAGFTKSEWQHIGSGSFSRPKVENYLTYKDYLFISYHLEGQKVILLFVDLRLEYVNTPTYVKANMALALYGSGRASSHKERVEKVKAEGFPLGTVEAGGAVAYNPAMTYRFQSRTFAYDGDTVELPKWCHLIGIRRNFAQEWRLDFACIDSVEKEFVEATLEVLRDRMDMKVVLNPGDMILQVDQEPGGVIVYVLRTAEMSPPFLKGI